MIYLYLKSCKTPAVKFLYFSSFLAARGSQASSIETWPSAGMVRDAQTFANANAVQCGVTISHDGCRIIFRKVPTQKRRNGKNLCKIVILQRQRDMSKIRCKQKSGATLSPTWQWNLEKLRLNFVFEISDATHPWRSNGQNWGCWSVTNFLCAKVSLCKSFP